jgi:hypothetical protein
VVDSADVLGSQVDDSDDVLVDVAIGDGMVIEHGHEIDSVLRFVVVQLISSLIDV